MSIAILEICFTYIHFMDIILDMKGGFSVRFQENLIHYREKAGYKSAKDFSEKLGINYTTYMGYENKGREPKYSLLVQIARLLHVSVDNLLGYDPEQPDELTRCLNVCKEAGLFADPWQFRGSTIVSVYQNKEEAEQDKFSVDVPILGKDEFIAAVNTGANNSNYQAAKKNLLKIYVYASILQKYAKSAGNINVDIESLRAGALPSKAKNAIQENLDALQENPDK